MNPPPVVRSDAQPDAPPDASPDRGLSRRRVLQGAALGATAVAAISIRPFDEAVASAPAALGIFGYGIASGDPTADAVVIWTRATPPTRRGEPVATPGSGRGRPLSVRWEVAADPRFRRIVRRGVVRTSAESDHTVKVDVQGLSVYTRYWYRFSARGQDSQIGATRTAPDEPGTTHALRLALVSCSNYTGGYFAAYADLAQRTDLDMVLHVGDYIYEYGNGADRYGPAALIGVRDSEPATETVDLRGYRLRHALHKADPDLQAAHRAHPWITIFDDHEVANNAWDTGAENHDPDTEGRFARRRREAYEAYLEWMPFRLPEQRVVPHRGTRFFKRFTYGDLADLSVLETRQHRSRQVDVAPFTTTGGGFIPTGDPAVEAQLADPGRHLTEPEQLAWLKEGLAGPRRWHLVGNQVVLTPVRFPGAALGVPAVPTLLNSDQWDGYQADQGELLRHLGSQPSGAGDAVVLTGDIHSSWAMDLPVDRAVGPAYVSAGVEFVCPSVNSDGFYEGFATALAGQAPEAVVATVQGATAAVRATNPWIQYLDGVGHGYVVLDVTPERVQADFHLTPTPTTAQPDPRIVPGVLPQYANSWVTTTGSRRVRPGTSRLQTRSDEPSPRR
ncbi:MAG: alkaline phosphatase D family protein [Nocardioides sp.]|nr:alkaline phosphatase D family protein [Nocardioides sp.]